MKDERSFINFNDTFSRNSQRISPQFSYNEVDDRDGVSSSTKKISLNLPKYQRAPCDCELVSNLSEFRRLRGQITFDTTTKSFYKSDLHSIELITDGLPYMKCPRHSLYFSDIIRSFVADHINRGKSLPRRILLFDGFSQNDDFKSPSHFDSNDERSSHFLNYNTGNFSSYQPINNLSSQITSHLPLKSINLIA